MAHTDDTHIEGSRDAKLLCQPHASAPEQQRSHRRPHRARLRRRHCASSLLLAAQRCPLGKSRCGPKGSFVMRPLQWKADSLMHTAWRL